MKASYANNTVVVTLSRRNLEALLVKLDAPRSARTLVRRQGGDEPDIIVVAESDIDHYADRDPGLMLPEHEDLMHELRRGRHKEAA